MSTQSNVRYLTFEIILLYLDIFKWLNHINMDNIKISTLEDIVDNVPTDALDTFLVDLKNWALLYKEIKKLKPNVESKYPSTMLWINDWKNEANITISATIKD